MHDKWLWFHVRDAVVACGYTTSQFIEEYDFYMLDYIRVNRGAFSDQGCKLMAQYTNTSFKYWYFKNEAFINWRENARNLVS